MRFGKRLCLLEAIEENRDWDETLSSNYSEFEKYRERIAREDFESAQAIFNNLLPSYHEIFHLVNQKNIDNGIFDMGGAPHDIGIFLVGYSIMPLILSIAELQPERIIFVVTDDTEYLVEEIKDGLKIIVDGAYYSDLLIQNNEDKKIAIDITGGKKTMVAGSFLASAQSRTCDIFYVDFEEYNSRKSEPVYGTEFMANVPNPSEIFSLADWDRLISLQENYQFKMAAKELERIEKNVEKFRAYFREDTRDRLAEIKNTLKGFEYWDDYQYGKAYECLPDKPALRILSEGAGEAQIYGNKTLLSYYLLDRLENAKRRKKQGQIQGAFLRFASLIEFVLMLWANNELTNDVKSNYKNGKYFTYNNLLHYLKDQGGYIIEEIAHEDLKALQWKRNNHILIHSMTVTDIGMMNKSGKCAEQIIWNLLKYKKISKNLFGTIETAVVF
ncbi:MAG: hypothetical protein B6I30_08845 [Desulfobacteraceae bacterium 4572_187]|nr:MAG: hypothetical protein B6I30_08845 [Desulfobacteraceae bacterium 4572_187]